MSDTDRITERSEDGKVLKVDFIDPVAPTARAVETVRKFHEMVASGQLIVEDDREETIAWAKEAFAALERERNEPKG
jgi:hypothetical protein